MMRNRAARSRAASDDHPPMIAYKSPEIDRTEVPWVARKTACCGLKSSRNDCASTRPTPPTSSPAARAIRRRLVPSSLRVSINLLGTKVDPGSQERHAVKKRQLLRDRSTDRCPGVAAAGTVKSARSGAAQSIEAASSAVRTRPLGKGGGSGGGAARPPRPAAWGPGERTTAWRTVPLTTGRQPGRRRLIPLRAGWRLGTGTAQGARGPPS